jgi:CMP-N-acetylneuraminic acid synthetase/spore coat polysaccharide biosynthesis predicted glycosyltransferase SpsG
VAIDLRKFDAAFDQENASAVPSSEAALQRYADSSRQMSIARGTDERPLLAIIPARGGSREVIGKNLRLLGGRPLISYTVDAVRRAGAAGRVIVSSDSDEILAWADLHGVESLQRPTELSEDSAKVSGVAAHVADSLDWRDDVGVFQPTSPFRTSKSIVAALEAFRTSNALSLASVVRENHLYWLDDEQSLAKAKPLFRERVNRQYGQRPVLRETGAIQLVKGDVLRDTRQLVTQRHTLFEMDEAEALDIDTVDDLVLARRRLERGLVVFRIWANRVIGSGHIHHCLQLADELADQRLHFLLHDCDAFVSDVLKERGYEFSVETDLASNLRELADGCPGVIVNDILDTSEADVLIERAAGLRVMNIEDLGPGGRLADAVVNALYPVDPGAATHVDAGPAFATLRAEFFDLPPKVVRETPERILVTFGGTDPGDLASRCARVLAGNVSAEIRVVKGPGAPDADFPAGVDVQSHVRTMAFEMLNADLILTSAGRTVYEAAAVGTPVLVLAQGARDATHAHLSYEAGVVFLGIGALVDDAHILEVVRRVLAEHHLRLELSDRLKSSIDGLGARRIAERIRGLLLGLAR